ncbi:hypothetical protein [Streptomyces sp. NPDC048277]|uniref:hypothetical protein n=1 Tax=Streptomyces sp. NPDC048277 TaxID=3155027 RepID=UPI0033CED00B
MSRALLREAVRLVGHHQDARTRRGPGGGLIVTEPGPRVGIGTVALFLEYRGVTADDLRMVRNAVEPGIAERLAKAVALPRRHHRAVPQARLRPRPAAARGRGRR